MSTNSTSGMYVAGFDLAVAKANGYKVVTLSNGDRQSVPINVKSGLPKGPVLHKATNKKRTGARTSANTDYAAVYGNCGQSWIRNTEVGNNRVSVASGYRYLPESAYYWRTGKSRLPTETARHAKDTPELHPDVSLTSLVQS